jgi:hypothetical protein
MEFWKDKQCNEFLKKEKLVIIHNCSIFLMLLNKKSLVLAFHLPQEIRVKPIHLFEWAFLFAFLIKFLYNGLGLSLI